MSHWLKVEGFVIEICPVPVVSRPSQPSAPPRVFSANVLAALERGRQEVNDLVVLYEIGTPEEIATAEWLRGAQITIDIIRARVRTHQWCLNHGGHDEPI